MHLGNKLREMWAGPLDSQIGIKWAVLVTKKYFFTQKGGGSIIMGKVSMTIKKEMFNKAYLPYLQDYSKRFSVFYGGA